MQITDEMVRVAAEAIEDVAIARIGRDLGTLHRDEIVRAGLEAAARLDGPRDASSGAGMDNAARADMRIEVVKRELNQGALAGFDSSVTDYAARLVIAALDSFDEEALAAEFRRGFEAGELNAALLHHAKLERLRAVADAAIVWRRQFEKPVKLPRMAALIAAVDALTEESAAGGASA